MSELTYLEKIQAIANEIEVWHSDTEDPYIREHLYDTKFALHEAEGSMEKIILHINKKAM